MSGKAPRKGERGSASAAAWRTEDRVGAGFRPLRSCGAYPFTSPPVAFMRAGRGVWAPLSSCRGQRAALTCSDRSDGVPPCLPSEAFKSARLALQETRVGIWAGLASASASGTTQSGTASASMRERRSGSGRRLATSPTCVSSPSSSAWYARERFEAHRKRKRGGGVLKLRGACTLHLKPPRRRGGWEVF